MKDKKQKNEQNAGAIAAKPKKKKKVLIAASFITPAHLYIWDEPLRKAFHRFFKLCSLEIKLSKQCQKEAVVQLFRSAVFGKCAG